MKRHIHNLGYSLFLLLVLLFSCNEDRQNIDPTGILYLNVEEDATLLTKATSEVTYEALQVAILQGEEDTLKVYNDYVTEVKGQRLILPVGTYTVVVRSTDADGAAWEKPLYQGSEEVEVKQGEITNTQIVCSIANTKVSVKYDSSMKSHFIDYQTEVSNSSGKLVYARDEYRSGYFAAEKLNVDLKLVNNDGNEFTLKKVYSDIQPQYHYTFEFKIANSPSGDENAGADVEVEIDEEHEEIIYNIFIQEEDLVGTGEPSFSFGGAFVDKVYSFKKTEEKPSPDANTIWMDYTMGSKNEIQSFTLTVNSKSRPDLNTLDIKSGEGSQIGFPGLPGEKQSVTDDRIQTYRLDLSALVESLGAVEDQPTQHTFTVNLIDDKYQEATETFTIEILPDLPAIANEPYCWTTFAVLQGNCSDNSSYFVLTTPNGDKEIKENIQRDDDGNISVLVTGLTPGSYSYTIRSANDADVKSNEVSFVVYDPTTGSYNVPNLGFDEWNTITKNMLPEFGIVTYSSGPYLAPNATDDFLEVYWESGNYGASAMDKILTDKTDDKVSNIEMSFAALLSSQYVGIEGMAGAFSAGSVFIGEPTSVGMSGAKLKYGRLHNGFPTRLSGYYKYSPGSIDYTKNKSGGSGTDQAIIYIALSTKAFNLESLRTNVDEVVRFDKNASEIIAYAELIESSTVSEYKHFDIPLIYKNGKMPSYSNFVDVDGTPKIYITIVATSSIDGDEFTGSTSSKLWIDEFSLDYDYNTESLTETEFKDMKPIEINE